MRKEPATRLLRLARLFAAEHAGISLDEIAIRFAVRRRTAERMRDAVAEAFPQLEEIEGERPKRWRLPSGLSGIFREPLAYELAALRGVARRLAHDGQRTSACALHMSAFDPKRTSTPIAPAGHRITVSWSLRNPVDFYRTAFELLCAGGPGASGAAASGVFAASAPLVTPFVASCAPLVTPFVASCAPLLTPLHPARLGLGI